MAEIAQPSKWKLDSSRVCVGQVDMKALQEPPEGKLQLLWIGHSTLLFQLDGLNILTDPLFCQGCTMIQWAGPKRWTQPALSVEQLPPIDVVLVSHNHYDHFDADAVKSLALSVRNWVCPLGVKKLIEKQGVDSNRITELDWWQSTKIADKLNLTCTPAQHSSGRGLFDSNKSLWCSFTLSAPSASIFFCGDSGYRSIPAGFDGDSEQLPRCPAFQEIGNQLGAYLSPTNLSPEDAVSVHVDVKAKHSIAMHWATFAISSKEDPYSGPEVVRGELQRRGLGADCFSFPQIGDCDLVIRLEDQNIYYTLSLFKE